MTKPIMLPVDGLYGESHLVKDNAVSSYYLRELLHMSPCDIDAARHDIEYRVAFRNLPRKKIRRELRMELQRLDRVNRRWWLLIQRKEHAKRTAPAIRLV